MNATDPSGDASVNLAGTAQWAFNNLLTSGDDGFGDDCTDFVSRALALGGGDPMTYSGDFAWDALHKHDLNLWFQVHDLAGLTETSSTWANANDLAQHLQLNGSQFLVSSLDLASASSTTASSGCSGSGSALSGGQPYDLPGDVQPGDVIFANWSGSAFSGISHAGILVGFEGQFLIAQHTHDTFDNFADWVRGGSDTHVWIVDPNEG